MLMHISRRQELVIHDGNALKAALSCLRESESVLGPELRDALVSLEGLDDDLDELVRSLPKVNPAVLEAALQRLTRHTDSPLGGPQW